MLQPFPSNALSAGLISGGVKLLYDTTQLDTPTVTKNDTDWYFGAGTSEHPYMDPEITENPPQGEVAFIVGKLDTNDNPQVGVNSARVLVGTATFARKTADILSSFQDAFFGISWDLGRTGGTYVNFVDTAGADLDSAVTLTHLKVVERGDANGDGSVNISDVTEIRNMVFNIIPATVYADCNADTLVNISDVTCIRDKVFP